MDDRVAELARRLKRGPLLPEGTGRRLHDDETDPKRALPHRPPMLLLDEVTFATSDGRVRARRRVDPGDPVFAGHFPSMPIYPGVLLVEMMAQAALAALPFLGGGGKPPPVARFTRIRDAAFISPVSPGDELDIHAEAIDDGIVVTALGQVRRAGELVAYAISEAYLDE